jgi:hypothetical protein
LNGYLSAASVQSVAAICKRIHHYPAVHQRLDENVTQTLVCLLAQTQTEVLLRHYFRGEELTCTPYPRRGRPDQPWIAIHYCRQIVRKKIKPSLAMWIFFTSP